MELPNVVRGDRSGHPTHEEISECWIYTPDAGLRMATVVNPDTTLVVGGQRLRSWCILDPTPTGCALVVIYSAEVPSRDVKRTATRLSRDRLEHRAWLSLTP